MKISLNLEELKDGFQIKRLSQKRLEKLNSELTTCPVWFLSKPVPIDGMQYTAVLVKGITPVMAGETRIDFERITCKAFTVFDKSTKELNQVTLLLPHGQFTFRRGGEERTSFSLDGPGCDPDVSWKSQFALQGIFSDGASSPICRRIVSHLKERAKPLVAA